MAPIYPVKRKATRRKPKPRKPRNPPTPIFALSNFDGLPDTALITVQVLSVLLTMGVSTIWRQAKLIPGFPAAIKLSPGCTRFQVGDVRRYIASKCANA